MTKAGNSQIMRTIPLLITIFSLSLPAYAQYSGGAGELNDPYQIATAEDLMLLGETPEDYDKHFILTADIDLDPNLPGRKVFEQAVIAPDEDSNDSDFPGIPFTGVFNGNGHIISHLKIEGNNHLGLFGQLGFAAKVSNLSLEAVDVNGTGFCVGGLVGSNGGKITACYNSGTVSGYRGVGGFVGWNCVSYRNVLYGGSILNSYSIGVVTGSKDVGGLVGFNAGDVSGCYSTSAVDGNDCVGGLVGLNMVGTVTQCYSTSAVDGNDYVGGLVGLNMLGPVIQCYSTSTVDGNDCVGGLVGSGDANDVVKSFWDIQASGQITSEGGMGRTTSEMQDIRTYQVEGWDFRGERANGLHEIWQMPDVGGYPILSHHSGYTPPQLEGHGTPDSPYLIFDGTDLGAVIYYNPSAHYRLATDIDLSGIHWGTSVIPQFEGTFDGSNHTVSHLVIRGYDRLGLFGTLVSGAQVKNIEIVDANITGSGNCVGVLVGINHHGTVTGCYSTGSVNGIWYVGGLVGVNREGNVVQCYSTGTVNGEWSVGGLVGWNYDGSIATSYSTGTVGGEGSVGGLVGGNNYGSITTSYSTGTVNGERSVGGLVGHNSGNVTLSFWDMQTSGLAGSDGGVGLTTVEMMDPYILGLNGFANDPNWILDDGLDYPRLAREGTVGQIIPEPNINWMKGHGSAQNPYMIETADQLILLGKASILWDKHFFLGADINLDPNLPNVDVFPQALIPSFIGVFDGNSHTISNLTITGGGNLGLFGQLASGAVVKNLGIVDVNITGSGYYVGGLVGYNGGGIITNCCVSGAISGDWFVGGLVGNNIGSITTSYSTGMVNGNSIVGGFVGANSSGSITTSYSTGMVNGVHDVGGLVGNNGGSIATSYSTCIVSGDSCVGGLVGNNHNAYNPDLAQFFYADGTIDNCYSTGPVSGNRNVGGFLGNSYQVASDYPRSIGTGCFWDIETSGQTTSAAGTGKTTAEMQTASTFLDIGWDFVDETANGTEDIWWILEGQDYPRLWWEAHD